MRTILYLEFLHLAGPFSAGYNSYSPDGLRNTYVYQRVGSNKSVTGKRLQPVTPVTGLPYDEIRMLIRWLWATAGWQRIGCATLCWVAGKKKPLWMSEGASG